MNITLKSPLDMHIHLRQDAMCRLVTPYTAAAFSGAVAMPNLIPKVDTLERLLAYREEILAAAAPHAFEPLLPLFMRAYSEAELAAAKPHIIAVKLYPDGVTTNSEGGVRSMEDIETQLAIMQDLDIPLQVHGETTDDFFLDREEKFLPTYIRWAEKFPRLRIVMEHLTTRAALTLLEQYENLYATITVHHMMITFDDVAGGMLQPHLFCKPVAKRAEDRDALIAAAIAHPKVMFGSDSAPHPAENKEGASGAAGVFSAPVALPALTGIFDKHNALDQLQAFVSDRAQQIYRLKPIEKEITLTKTVWQVPERTGNVVPFLAGQTLDWALADA